MDWQSGEGLDQLNQEAEIMASEDPIGLGGTAIVAVAGFAVTVSAAIALFTSIEA